MLPLLSMHETCEEFDLDNSIAEDNFGTAEIARESFFSS